MSELNEILTSVLAKVTPSPLERERVNAAVERVVKALKETTESLSVHADVEVEGSFAKDTWLSGDVDVDIFLLFDPEVSLEELRVNGLAASRRAAQLLGVEWVERYASHPYLTLKMGVCDVDVVPAYKVRSASQIVSPVDRTPFHTQYVKERLDEKPTLRNEVRLLKRFAKGIGVYGAEIRVEGFSGYLTELLVIYYGSFLGVLQSASAWRPYKVAIDVEGHYPSMRSIFERFRDPLVVVDPVDPKRNVASPVSLESLSKFIAAARAFLRKPSLSFFFPPQVEPVRLNELLRSREVIAVKLSVPPLAEDVLWGQAKRALKAVSSGLERFGFKVLGHSAWSDGKELVLLYELETLELPPLEKHEGPPVYSDHDERFVAKYLAEGCTAGPYVEGEKWAVIRSRKVRRAEEALSKLLSTYNLGEHITRSVKRGVELFLKERAAEASANDDYKRHLYEWLMRKPAWL